MSHHRAVASRNLQGADPIEGPQGLLWPAMRLCLAVSLCLFFLATVCSAVIVK
jgi:hypothetical protein